MKRRLPQIKTRALLPVPREEKKTWWREGFNVAMRLSTITWQPPKGRILCTPDDLWDVDGFKWKLKWSDVTGNGDYMEEQIWAMHEGLA